MPMQREHSSSSASSSSFHHLDAFQPQYFPFDPLMYEQQHQMQHWGQQQQHQQHQQQYSSPSSSISTMQYPYSPYVHQRPEQDPTMQSSFNILHCSGIGQPHIAPAGQVRESPSLQNFHYTSPPVGGENFLHNNQQQYVADLANAIQQTSYVGGSAYDQALPTSSLYPSLHHITYSPHDEAGIVDLSTFHSQYAHFKGNQSGTGHHQSDPTSQQRRPPRRGEGHLLTWTWSEEIPPVEREPAKEQLLNVLRDDIGQNLTNLAQHFCLQALKRNATRDLLARLYQDSSEERRAAVKLLLEVPGFQEDITEEQFNERRTDLIRRIKERSPGKSKKNVNTWLGNACRRTYLLVKHLYSIDHDIMEDAFQRMFTDRNIRGESTSASLTSKKPKKQIADLKNLFGSDKELRKRILDKLTIEWCYKDSKQAADHLRGKLFKHPKIAKRLLKTETFPKAAYQLAPRAKNVINPSDSEDEKA